MVLRIVTARDQAELALRWASWDDYDDSDYDQRRAQEDEMWGDHTPSEPDYDAVIGHDYDPMNPDEESEYLRSASEAELAHRKNTSWDTYKNMAPPRDHGRNGPRPRITVEPVGSSGRAGIMARHAADGRPIGHLMWDVDGEIASVNVHPDFHGTGIANAMLHHARTNPEVYRSEQPIHHSNILSPQGERWARSDPHHTMPPDSEIIRAPDSIAKPHQRYHTYLSSGHNYVPLGVEYTGQTEPYMKKMNFLRPGHAQSLPPGQGYGGPRA